MVAISLYRGNLHRVPDVPRRWLMPTPRISLKDFKTLLHRRSEALSRPRCSSPTTTTTAVAAVDASATTSTPNPNNSQQKDEGVKDNGCSNSDLQPQLEPEKFINAEEENGEVKDQKVSDGGDDLTVKLIDGPDFKPVVPDNAADPVDGHGNSQALRDQKPAVSANPNSETSNKADALNDTEKRKRDVEEKLQVLNAKKHNLVQVLKQILNAEEELKRRNSMRPSVPLQVDASNDSGSMTRHIAPRLGSEANLGGDMEGGETDDVSNHNMHSRHLLRMSSTSPSSESPLRRPAYIQHNAVPHSSRASLAAAGSPSRFAPSGHQGHPANMPTVSVSGTNYIASSPSPAASGGTSVFRDARLPSPWN